MKKLVEPAILSISLLVIMTGNAVSPALAEISKAFPDTDSSLIKMILTLPSFVIIPFSFISGKMSQFIKKRKIIIMGLVLYIFGGLSGIFSKNIYELLLFRGILGIGMGLIMPFTTSLIADFYKGTERTVMMGLSNAVANLGGIVSTLIAGSLAIYNWRYIFGVYSIAIIVLLLIILELPEPSLRDTGRKKSFSINNRIFLIAGMAFLLNIAFYSVVINISLFITNEHIGNSGYSGIALSFITLSGFISGVCLRQLSKLLKKLRVPFAITLMSFGFLFLSASYDLTSILISNFLIGFGLGTLKPILFLNVAKVTPSHSNAFAISIVSNSILLGKFTSPFFMEFWSNIFNNYSIRFMFLSMGLALGFASISSLIIILYSTKFHKYSK